MTNHPVTYVHQQLAAAGFVFIDARIAVEQRADLFSNGIHDHGMFLEARQRQAFSDHNFRGPLLRLLATVEGRAEPVELLARCPDRLAERVREVTGYVVTELRPMEAAKTTAAIAERQTRQNASSAERTRQEKIDKLRALAAKELPTYECSLRKEILEARRQLAGMGQEIGGFVPA